ncbi:hypothetical protein Sjap_008946 [Stephania japonica]|uniref:Uncharacterized protein n=1 Tax=Stephania japonica TaxID=461633 RepID=A0AAP0PBV0_9MAGN
MGKIVPEKAFEWVMNEPNFVRASGIICLLMVIDDLVSRKFVRERACNWHRSAT